MGLIKFFGLDEKKTARPKRVLWWHEISEIPEHNKQILLYFSSGHYGDWFVYKNLSYGEWIDRISDCGIRGRVMKWAYLVN